ncbi:DUF6682 family protein [Rhodoferax ferrireducens]|uniref:phage adaptor protein n=1 Tax=Rhodoferax ferrireducens TaxID=192843 RepID=UPI000E0D6F09|nr:DUF6682 family protein [Rhodoferax ferrireducens]
MTLAELIAKFRVDADDGAIPPKWVDASLFDWFTDAEAEAAIRGRLLHESTSKAVCQIAIKSGASGYALHESLYEIDYLAFLKNGDSTRTPVKLVSREYMDQIRPCWREETGLAEFAIQTDTRIRLSRTPDSAGTLFIEGYRVPLEPLTSAGDEPEIHKSHHAQLVQWVLFRAFSVPDAETMDPNRAALANQAFTNYFGERPDSNLRRSSTEDTEHHNQAHWV